jgi:hypothetical protein
MRVMISLREFQQIRDAVSELRAVSPKSVLADLVEEKIRAIEASDPVLQFDITHFHWHRPVTATRDAPEVLASTDTVHAD